MSNADIDALQVGSVVRHKDDLRVVRAITWHHKRNRGMRKGAPTRFAVTFVKRRSSQYSSPFTVYFRADLLSLSFRATGVRTEMRSELDRRIAADVQRYERGERCRLTANDVRGVA